MFDLFGIVKIGLKLLCDASSGSWYWVGFDIDHLKTSGYGGVAEVMKFLDRFLIPVTIGLLALAVVLAIAVGINLAKAETASAAQEAKKRLWGIAIGFGAFMAALWIGAIIMNNIPEIVKGLQEVFSFTGSDGWKKVDA